MAQQSLALTHQAVRQYYVLYIPLYLSNVREWCTYCGFSMENRIKRRTLTLDEIDAESAAIKR